MPSSQRTLLFLALVGFSVGCAGKPVDEEATKPAEEDFESALSRAAYSGDTEAAQRLLSRGSPTPAPVSRADLMGPLIIASSQGSAGVADLLLAHGAAPNAADSFGDTPLSAAAQHGQLDVARLLLDKGADPNLPSNGELPLVRGINRHDIVELLLERGTKVRKDILVSAAEHGDPYVLDLLIKRGAEVNSSAPFGTALSQAARYGNTAAVSFLLTAGARANPRNKDYNP